MCYSACTPGTIPLPSDPTFCVATTPCQLQSTQDIAYNMCNKTPIAMEGPTCDVGYTEWLDGLCFANCNSLFIENGTTCIKKTYLRDSTSALYTETTSTDDTNNWLFIICIILLVFVFLIFAVVIWRYEYGNKSSIINVM
jgi:hypothetical protein